MIAKVPATLKKHLTFTHDIFVKKIGNYLDFVSLFQQALNWLAELAHDISSHQVSKYNTLQALKKLPDDSATILASP